MVVSGLVESHTPNALTLSFTHLKSFSGARFVSFPAATLETQYLLLHSAE